MAEPSSTASDPGNGLCPVCRTAMAAAGCVQCPDCRATYHAECWEYNGGCGHYGCPSAPAVAKLEEMEIPASYWGKTEKACPQCGQVIQAAAVRCRGCGATFASARPQEADEYFSRQAVENDLPGIRRAGIWLLVFSMLPCTAPVAAVVGGLWYSKRRDRVAALPASQSAIPKIALIIACTQTVLLVLAVILHTALSPR